MHISNFSRISQVEKTDFSVVGLVEDMTAWSDKRKVSISLFLCVLSIDNSQHILGYIVPLQGCMIDRRLKSLATMVILS